MDKEEIKIILENENGIVMKEFVTTKENISCSVCSISFKDRAVCILLNDFECNERYYLKIKEKLYTSNEVTFIVENEMKQEAYYFKKMK